MFFSKSICWAERSKLRGPTALALFVSSRAWLPLSGHSGYKFFWGWLSMDQCVCSVYFSWVAGPVSAAASMQRAVCAGKAIFRPKAEDSGSKSCTTMFPGGQDNQIHHYIEMPGVSFSRNKTSLWVSALERDLSGMGLRYRYSTLNSPWLRWSYNSLTWLTTPFAYWIFTTA